MEEPERKTSCDRCGSCCLQGGPALHTGDLELIRSGSLALDDLITIRRGEFALRPLSETPESVDCEFIKIQGKSAEWCCKFYDATQKACTIYQKRPLACGLFDCTAPEAVLAIIGKDLLSRFDCVADDDPLLPLMRLHEQECPYPDMKVIADRLQAESERSDTLLELTRLVKLDLGFRTRAVRRHGLSVAREMFYFGRPLFQML
ncbi:MAG: YkgJ family cysteine cluster protein [Desulfobulbaceae bacterium]|nr:YkgJ family cysteine cluster protein [Desulfobulbaceae bacterium]